MDATQFQKIQRNNEEGENMNRIIAELMGIQSEIGDCIDYNFFRMFLCLICKKLKVEVS